MKIIIVVVAYNRPKETIRLLNSLLKADYSNDVVDLVVSIDKGERQDEIAKLVNQIKWEYGNFNIIIHKTKMGLRPHIFKCASLIENYDALILLEDDLIVAPSFYQYAKAACEYYDSDIRIAEISLYSYSVNEFEARPFYPEKIEGDTYAMQVVQSWGECWTKRMWNDFQVSQYYEQTEFLFNNKLHRRVNSWGKNSWKKNFSNFLIESGSYVIYPYISYTSNYSEVGEHQNITVPDYHVVMQSGNKYSFKFFKLDMLIRYDSFFERIFDENQLELKEICIDLYGSKNTYNSNRFVATTKLLPYKIIQEYGLIRKPQEVNLIEKEKGKGIFIYDTSIVSKPPHKINNILLRYDFTYLSWKRSLMFGFSGLCNAIKKRIGL